MSDARNLIRALSVLGALIYYSIYLINQSAIAGPKERQIGETAGRYLGAALLIDKLGNNYCTNYFNKKPAEKQKAYNEILKTLPSGMKLEFQKLYTSGAFNDPAFDLTGLFKTANGSDKGFLCGMLASNFSIQLNLIKENWQCAVSNSSDPYCADVRAAMDTFDRLIAKKHQEWKR